MNYKQLLVGVGIIVLVLVSTWFGVKLFAPAPVINTFGAANVEPHTFQDELTFVSGSFWGIQKMQIPPGVNYVAWTNNSGATTTALAGEIQVLSGTASSSYKVMLFATSTPTLVASQLSAAPIPAGGVGAMSSAFLIKPITYATSTTATTTNSIAASANGMVQVPPGWAVIALMQNSDVGCVSTGSTTAPVGGGMCESATSSARGIDPLIIFQTQR